jgi:hypothetical protein
MDELERRSRREQKKARKAVAARNAEIANRNISGAQHPGNSNQFDNDGKQIYPDLPVRKYGIPPEYMH